MKGFTSEWYAKLPQNMRKDSDKPAHRKVKKQAPAATSESLRANGEAGQQEKVYVLPGRGKKAPKSSEHKEQRKVFDWAKENEHLHPELAALFAIPNGGKRFKKTAAILKAEGAKAGVNDIHLPCPIGGYAGLWIEMKYGYNMPSQEQKEWMDLMRWLGHRVEVCYSAEQAIDVILDYVTKECIKLAA